jgi:Tol biopolymer transport system component
MKTQMMSLMLLLIALSSLASAATGPYFGQTPPGTTPTIFAPGILSLTNRWETRIAFSPDGNECFFTVPNVGYTNPQLYYTTCVNGVWTSQQPAPFMTSSSKNEPFYSADGNTLYFTSNANGSRDLWKVQRSGQGWGTPQVLPSPINSSANEYFYSETTAGIAYFVSERSGGYGATDLYRTRAGTPLQVENLGGTINTSNYEYDPCIAPDGSYLIFAANRYGGNNMDLYLSRSDGKGGWTAPVDMNTIHTGYNTSADEFTPTLSPDGRYLFFARNDGSQCDDYWVANPMYVPEPALVIQFVVAAVLLVLFSIRCLYRRVRDIIRRNQRIRIDDQWQ